MSSLENRRLNNLVNESFDEEQMDAVETPMKVERSGSYSYSNTMSLQSNSSGLVKSAQTGSNVMSSITPGSEIRRPKAARGGAAQMTTPAAASTAMDIQDSIHVDQKITFVQEKDFKVEKTCVVCKIMFGKINERQHHCRLCAHSVCKVCSEKRVNDQRVCDICFLKLKNMKGEKRKRKLLAAMKTFIKNLSVNIKNGVDESNKLKEKSEVMSKQTSAAQSDRDKELEALELALKIAEDKSNKAKKEAEKQEELLVKKRSEKQRVQDESADIESKLKNLSNDITLLESTLQSRENQLIQIQRQKRELENSESFVRLPNYERAKRNDPEKISEAILFLDSTDLRNGINHYNTVSQDNVFMGVGGSNQILSGNSSVVSKSKEKRIENAERAQKSSDYASSYNQGLVDEVGASEIIQHNARSGKKNRKNNGPGCFCE